ncbi:MAG: Uma2 family endonuclease [Leptolyngbyaceae cyanobacterium bins.59]|nr:Uma2 family endonuclease [Leptolyngbyaceae cyanobacterium bins.59]
MLSTIQQQRDQRVVLHGVSWQTYKLLLTELGDRRSSRLAYDEGVLEITMPSDRHETNTHLLERLVDVLTEELDRPVKCFRSTTLNRDDLQKGAEPDSCYYIQSVSRIVGRTIDLDRDPPPDLVIEVDISSPSSRKFQIYQSLGVPEIWRYRKNTVEIHQLQDGNYVMCQQSPTFTFISTSILNQFLQDAETQDDTALIRTWRRWVRDRLQESC